MRGRAHCYGRARAGGGVAASPVGGAGGGARLPPWVLFDGLWEEWVPEHAAAGHCETGETGGTRRGGGGETEKKGKEDAAKPVPAS